MKIPVGNDTVATVTALAPMPRNTEDDVIYRLTINLSISRDDATELFKELKNFLALAADSPKVLLIPAPLIDEAWHTFILFTRMYQAYCQEQFGRFIHHRPATEHEMLHGSKGELADAIAVTKRMMEKRFGTLSDYWTYPAEASWSSDPSSGDPD
ncbi:MAG: hypothetical protein WC087_03770 [Candidatus Paceibacterota bacterium]